MICVFVHFAVVKVVDKNDTAILAVNLIWNWSGVLLRQCSSLREMSCSEEQSVKQNHKQCRVLLKRQQDPHCLWFLTSETALLPQSTKTSSGSLEGVCRRSGVFGPYHDWRKPRILVHGLGVSHFSLLQFGVVFLDLGQVVSEEVLTADFFNRRAVFHLVWVFRKLNLNWVHCSWKGAFGKGKVAAKAKQRIN